jgi:hypothetical protein
MQAGRGFQPILLRMLKRFSKKCHDFVNLTTNDFHLVKLTFLHPKIFLHFCVHVSKTETEMERKWQPVIFNTVCFCHYGYHNRLVNQAGNLLAATRSFIVLVLGH